MRVGDLTWDVVATHLTQGALAVLPIGAGAKQHGFHLPMATDRVQAEWLADEIAKAHKALVWPTLTYGHYPAFATYAGSTTLSAKLFEDLVAEILGSLMTYRPCGVILVDTGISTIAPIDRAIDRQEHPERLLHLKVYHGAHFRAAETQVLSRPHGQHADEMETSIMLALAHGTVAMAKATIGTLAPPGPGPLQHDDPSAPNYSASGSIGDPRGATKAKGEALLAAMMTDIDEQVEAWARNLPTP